MNKWWPPEYGPLNPSRRNFCTSLRQEMLLAIANQRSTISIHLGAGHALMVAYLEHQPGLQYLAQFIATLFKRTSVCPHPTQAWYLAKIGPIRKQLIACGHQLFMK